MEQRTVLKLLAVLVILVFSVSAFAQHSYVGASKCKMCHKGEKKGMIYEKWEGEKHAKATETIIAEGEGTNEKCLKCHSTGYGEGGYDPAAEDPTVFAGVQCEACHGPGSDYKSMSTMKDRDASIANGLIIPDENVCVKCHNNSHHEDMTFDFETAWKQIEHRVPKTE